MTTITYDDARMNCGHCVRPVTTGLGALGGVRAVVVDVRAGIVSVRSDHPLEMAVVRAAIDEAGYELTGASA